MPLTRRDFLASGAGALSALSGAQDGFRYRGYLGWITDLATMPDTNAAWPSMRINRQLLKDYSATFEVMKELGFQDLCVWGLYVSRAWPVDITSCGTAAAGKARRAAHCRCPQAWHQSCFGSWHLLMGLR